jgi:hypothetical protein
MDADGHIVVKPHLVTACERLAPRFSYEISGGGGTRRALMMENWTGKPGAAMTAGVRVLGEPTASRVNLLRASIADGGSSGQPSPP